MREWELDYASLSELNPDLVMISITPFGQTGPYADWNGYDLNAYHLTGASSRYCGRPGEPPLEHGTFAADFFGAAAAAAWGLAAVLRTANAWVVASTSTSPCAEAIAATFVGGQNIGGYAQDGVFDRRTGVGMPLGAPATILPCKDGHVWMLALEPGQWNGLANVMGNPDWMQLEMFQDMFVRAQNADAIYPLIEEWTMEHSKWEIMEQCQANGCPVTAVFTVEEAAEHPHLKERGYIVELEHPVLGRFATSVPPSSCPRAPAGPASPLPCSVSTTQEVFGELLGMTRRRPATTESAAEAINGRSAPPRGHTSRELRLGVGRARGRPDPRLPGSRGVQDRVARPRRPDAQAAALCRGRARPRTAASPITPAGPATAASPST